MVEEAMNEEMNPADAVEDAAHCAIDCAVKDEAFAANLSSVTVITLTFNDDRSITVDAEGDENVTVEVSADEIDAMLAGGEEPAGDDGEEVEVV